MPTNSKFHTLRSDMLATMARARTRLFDLLRRVLLIAPIGPALAHVWRWGLQMASAAKWNRMQRTLWYLAHASVGRRPIVCRARSFFGATFSCRLDDFIEARIFFFGVWEPRISRLIGARLRSGDCMIDIGANCGYFSLLAARAVGANGKVLAIEPMPTTLARLRANVDADHADNVRIAAVAVAPQSGRVKFYPGSPTNAGTASLVDQFGFGGAIEVQAAPLALIVKPHERAGASIIKLDIEGGEWPVLDGIVGDLAGWPSLRNIIAEITLTNQARAQALSILERFRAAGFSLRAIDNDYDPQAGYFGFGLQAQEMPRLTEFDTTQAGEGRYDVVLERGIW